jgi:GPH family glycoside/pentoside/hexuronide:cation symporter
VTTATHDTDEEKRSHPAQRRDDSKEPTLPEIVAYAAPMIGSGFLYIPMFSILPGVYAKYFGLPLTSIAASVLFIRLFDGFLDTSVGYLSDWHHSAGGSRRPWVITGGLISVASCYFLFVPAVPVTISYYLSVSLAYFLGVAVSDIPHTTWGNDLTMDYQGRAHVFGVRTLMQRIGIAVFYGLPLWPGYLSTAYTPQVLQDAVVVGGFMAILGLGWAFAAAPVGISYQIPMKDRQDSLLYSLIGNKPLLLYVIAYGCGGLCYGMWFGVLYFYLDSYLGLGAKAAMMFLSGTIVATVSTPFLVRFICRTSKSTAWATCVLVFVGQLIASWFLRPGSGWCIPLILVVIANICFSCHDISTNSILGDIIDYGKLKFNSDRGATYVAINTLTFKVGLGIGAGISIGIAGLSGFTAAHETNSAGAILGMKTGFVILPACLAFVSLLFIVNTPINKRRHRIIRRRIEWRLLRSRDQLVNLPRRTPPRQASDRVAQCAGNKRHVIRGRRTGLAVVTPD